jgi:hypothetical protein
MALEQITFNIGAFNDSDAGGNNYFTDTVFEVKNQSDDTFATIYADASGATQIPQNGIDNVSNSRGECNFYIDDGDFYLEVDSQQKKFKIGRDSSGGLWDSDFFKIKGDGVSNDTVKIQEAINYINSIGGGTLYFKPGTYLFNDVLLRDNVSLIGASRDSVIFDFFTDDEDSQLLTNIILDDAGHRDYYNHNGDYLKNVTIRGISITPSIALDVIPFKGFVAAIHLLNPSNVVIERCRISPKMLGIHLESSPDKRTLDAKHDCVIRDNEFTYQDPDNQMRESNGYINATSFVNNVKLLNNKFRKSRVTAQVRGFESNVGTEAIGCDSWLIEGNVFENNKKPNDADANGLYWRGQNSTIRDNTFRDNEGNFIDMQSSENLSATNVEAQEKGNLIEANRFILTPNANFRNDGLIHCRSGGVKIVNNQFVADWSGSTGSNKECITAKWGKDLLIEGNMFNTNTFVAMEISSTPARGNDMTGLQIKNNTFNTSNSSSFGAIRLNAYRPMTAQITGNDFSGVNNAIYAIVYEDLNNAGEYHYPKVSFTNNFNYSSIDARTGLINFQKVDGDFSFSVEVNESSGSSDTPSNSVPFASVRQVLRTFMPNSGSCSGQVVIDVTGDSATELANSTDGNETPNLSLTVTTSNSSKINNFQLFNCRLGDVKLENLELLQPASTYAIRLSQDGIARSATVENVSYTGSGRFLEVESMPCHVSGCDIGSGLGVGFRSALSARLSVSNCTGSSSSSIADSGSTMVVESAGLSLGTITRQGAAQYINI